jgi:hypothetical protein
MTTMFQKRHYEVIAEEVKGFYWVGKPDQRAIADRFADRFAHDNPNFDRSRFLKACGLEG